MFNKAMILSDNSLEEIRTISAINPISTYKPLSELIIENRKLFEKLNYDVQQKFGFEMYRMKLFKFEQVNDILAKSMFYPFELGKQMASLVEAFKDLLKTNLKCF